MDGIEKFRSQEFKLTTAQNVNRYITYLGTLERRLNVALGYKHLLFLCSDDSGSAHNAFFTFTPAQLIIRRRIRVSRTGISQYTFG